MLAVSTLVSILMGGLLHQPEIGKGQTLGICDGKSGDLTISSNSPMALGG